MPTLVQVLMEPRILILDEATSALDNESEHLVQVITNGSDAVDKRTMIETIHNQSKGANYVLPSH